ncbi:MAG: ribulokinase [Spirochaetes bacterium]|nr:MAG: ribulokinase [Spirochaetota bacterium]
MTDYPLVLGLDFGTDSCRAVIVDAKDGSTVSNYVSAYRRWSKGKYCEASENRFRQHPLDYIEAMQDSVKGALKQAPEGTAERIAGISAATTGSTPAAVDRTGMPLALLPAFSENPNAMFILWKDHTALKEAEEINKLSHSWSGTDYTKYEGGIYSSEWFWAKMLHVLREDKEVRKSAYSWMEHCDWMPALLTGNKDSLAVKRSRCAAGHKAMWHESFGGLPSNEFLVKLDPLLGGIRERLYKYTYTSDVPAGKLCREWADRLGLKEGIAVGVGALDAHMGAVGAGITVGSFVKVMGTSSCDMAVAEKGGFKTKKGEKLVKGICGQVDGSIMPGMIGLEAGQSAFGDIYAWFKDILSWPLKLISGLGGVDSDSAKKIAESVRNSILSELDKEAVKINPEESGVIAVDWLNGRRTPDANQALKGAIYGLTLGTNAPRIYRALVEATAFGTRRIAERFEEEGVPVDNIIAIGGVAKNSPFVVQTIADVMKKRIKVSASDQTVGLGAAMFAAVAGGIYRDIPEAQKAMECGFEAEYEPNESYAEIYDKLYNKYIRIGSFIEEEYRKSLERV